MVVTNTPRAAGPYFGNDVTTTFAYGFRVLNEADLEVRLSEAGVPTVVLTLDVDYTVTGVDEGTGGDVVLTTPLATGQRLDIIGAAAYTQPLALENQGPYFARDIMRALDRIVIQTQQLAEAVNRAVVIPPEDDVTDIDALVASVTALDAIRDDLSALAAIIADIQTVAGIDTAVTTLAAIAAAVSTTASISASITAVAAVDAEVVALAAVAGSIAALGPLAADIATLAAVASQIVIVSGIAADVETVAGIAANVTTLAGIAGNITTVAGIAANVTTVAGIAANVITVAGVAAAVSAVAAVDAEVVTVAGIAADVAAVADLAPEVTNFADVYQGAKATPPTLRNDGTALQTGDLYFDTATSEMKVRTASATWVTSGPSDVASAIALAAPPGAVVSFARATPPTGWLKANGALVSRTTYADLFAAIGTTFGAGDGSTTFALPDLRGEFIRGWDDGRGADSGRAFGSNQSSQNLAHSHTGSTGSAGAHDHTYTRINTTGSGQSGSFVTHGAALTTTSVSVSSAPAHTHTIPSDGGTEARPRNVALLACIKF